MAISFSFNYKLEFTEFSFAKFQCKIQNAKCKMYDGFPKGKPIN